MSFSFSLRTFFSKFNVLAKYHSNMIGMVEAVDKEFQVVSMVDPKTRRRIKIKYNDCFEQFLTRSINELVEIVGNIQIDRNQDPLAITKLENLKTVDTSDLKISQVLPRFLKLSSANDPLIRVKLDDSHKFYRARLPVLSVFACAETRDLLKERLAESIEVCWDAFVGEDSCDFDQNAKILREKLLQTFVETE